MIRTAIIAAMEREIDYLALSWKDRVLTSGGRTMLCHENGDLIVLAAGIGAREAEHAARWIVQEYHPEVLISAGLAGALIRPLKVGSIVLPSVVVDAESGAEYRCDPEEDVVSGGLLVTANQIAEPKTKEELVTRFHALIVDMEAAGVARVAHESGIKFRCVKAVSDEFDFSIPPFFVKFIDKNGKMRTAHFACWAALRPRHWPSTVRLARNSRRAARALGEWLTRNVAKIPGGPIAKLETATLIRGQEVATILKRHGNDQQN